MWNKGHATSYFSAQPQPKCRCTLGKTRTRLSNQRNQFNPIRTEWYNTQDKDTIDFNKIDIIKPAPKWLCTRTQEECTYHKFHALHPSVTPSDWSSEDWDGDKAKARDQCPLLNFKLLEQQIQKTLQDRTKDTPPDMTHNATADKQETDLVNSIQDLTLESKLDTQNLTDVPAPPPDVPEVNGAKEKIGQMSQWQHQHTRWQTRRSDYRKRKKSTGSIWAPLAMKGMILTWTPETESDSDTWWPTHI